MLDVTSEMAAHGCEKLNNFKTRMSESDGLFRLAISDRDRLNSKLREALDDVERIRLMVEQNCSVIENQRRNYDELIVKKREYENQSSFRDFCNRLLLSCNHVNCGISLLMSVRFV